MKIYKKEQILEEDIAYCAKEDFLKILDGSKVFIIGVSGMIGSYVMRVLLKFFQNNAGSVSGLCRNPDKAKSAIGREFHEQSIIAGDICDKSIALIDDNYDYIIFAAGYTDKNICQKNPEEIYRVNTMGLDHALEFAVRSKCKKFLFLSSASVYGNVGTAVCKEDKYGSLVFDDPNQIYAESKRMAECICRSFSGKDLLDIAVVRPFHMYGPGMRLDNSNLVNYSIERRVAGKDIILQGDGLTRRNMTYLRDMVSHILMILCSDKKNITINLGSDGNDITVKEWAETIAYNSAIQVIQNINEGTKGRDYDIIPCLHRQNELLRQFSPHSVDLTIAEGIDRTLDYFLWGGKTELIFILIGQPHLMVAQGRS